MGLFFGQMLPKNAKKQQSFDDAGSDHIAVDLLNSVSSTQRHNLIEVNKHKTV